jgi:hypothetical protein
MITIDLDIDIINGELLDMSYELLNNPEEGEDDEIDHSQPDPDLQAE